LGVDTISYPLWDGVVRFYNVISRKYDIVSTFEWGTVEEYLKLVELGRCDYALDVGCGTDRFLNDFLVDVEL